MKNKAFTLVELLAVIAILGVVALIVVPTVDKAIGTGKNQMLEAQKAQIIKGAKDYLAMNTSELPEEENDLTKLTVKKLQEQGFLQLNIKNPKNDDYVSPLTEIQVTKVGDSYNYTVIESTLDSNESGDDKPEIILTGGPIQYVELGSVYSDAGYKATTVNGADITSSVTTIILDKMGNEVTEISTNNITTYTVKYFVTDPNDSSKSSESIRTVMIVDTTKPTINLLKGDYLEISAIQVPGFNYDELVSATDNYGSTKVTYTSNLSQLEGTYYVTYTATDTSGNVATKRVTINVTGGIKITVEDANIYTTQKNVNISFPEYIDDNYINQYSLDNGNTWITAETSTEDIVLTKTTFLIVRLYDGSSTKLSTTYTITNFENE